MIFKKGHYKSRLDEKMGNWCLGFIAKKYKRSSDNQDVNIDVLFTGKIYVPADVALKKITLLGS
jgi:hypothetical protein